MRNKVSSVACVGMPWRNQAMKDAASGDTLRGSASNL